MHKIIYSLLIGFIIGVSLGFYISNKTKPNIYIPSVVKEYVDGKEVVRYIYEKINPDDLVKKNISNDIKQDINTINSKKNIGINVLYPKMYYTGKIGLGVSLLRIYVVDLDTFITYSKNEKVNLYGNLGISYHLPFKRLSNTSVGICKEINIKDFSEQKYRLYLAINF